MQKPVEPGLSKELLAFRRKGDGAVRRDFLISYNLSDRSWADWLSRELVEAGFSVMVQAWDFRPGSNFTVQMQEIAARVAKVLVVLSPDYLAAILARPEWAAAFAKDPAVREGRLLVLRVRRCDPKPLLGSLAYLDVAGLDEAAAREVLLTGVGRPPANGADGPPPPIAAAPATPPLPAGHPLDTEGPLFPGALPRVFAVANRRNPSFTGRGKPLTRLREALASGIEGSQTQVICGLSGMGKTQLALEHAYRHAADYDLVWWVRAETPAQRASDYAALASALGLHPPDSPDQRRAAEAVRHVLEHTAGWLLVFDDADEPAALQDYLPAGGAGHVLITTRNPNGWTDAGVLHLAAMERPESVEFLLDRTDTTDAGQADALADALGDLPLALAQAAACIEDDDLAPGAFLDLFRSRRQEALSRGRPPEGYPHTVAAVLEASLERVRQASPAAADLLNLCAYLAPDDIPLSLLTEGADLLPKSLAGTVARPFRLTQAVAALTRFSLVAVAAGDQALSFHRLVQAIVREDLPEAAQHTWATTAVRLVDRAFPSRCDDVSAWPLCSRLLSHAAMSVEHAERLGAAPLETSRLLNAVGLYMRGRGHLREAKAALLRALKIAEAAHGIHDPALAVRLNNLGDVLLDLNEAGAARLCFEHALTIEMAAHGPDHPATATVVNNLGGALRALGDLAGARKCFEQALAADEALYGPNHPSVAIRLGNLGAVLRDLGHLAGARACFERALAIDEAASAPNHPIVATDLNSLGLVHKDLGDLKAARGHLERALGIDESAYGKSHPTVARDLNHLAGVLRGLGDAARARVCLERALRICRTFYGEHHPKTRSLDKTLKSLDG
jgi:tetratricopeptide (TPR) repeat protein